MAKLTVKEVATRLGKDERTIRRWIDAGTLAAQPGVNGRLLIDEEDVERLEEDLLPLANQSAQQAKIPNLEERLHSVEDELAQLRARVAQFELLIKPPQVVEGSMTPRLPARNTTHHNTPQSSDMPAGLVGWREFCKHIHGVSESTVHKAIQAEKIPVVDGNWTVGKAPVRQALDVVGQAIFYMLYKDNPNFTRCDHCPHLLPTKENQ
jgi:excisionase family DNA binding protein